MNKPVILPKYVGNPETLHKKIVKIKEEEGDPRPEGMTLSLINAVSPYTYWSNWCILWDKAYRRRLSLDARDYAWETNADNLRHNAQDNYLYLGLGLLTFKSGDAPQWMRREYHGPIDTVDLRTWLVRGSSPLKQQLVKELDEWMM